MEARPTESAGSILTGRRFGSYEVHDVIGTGGMGEVYRARDTKLHRDVAIKVLPKALRFDAERMARLDQEARMLAALNHPNIATIHGFEDFAGACALVLELVEGPTLAEYFRRGPVPADEALAFARQIIHALRGAHQRGIIHRDLKPANIKLRPDGVIKLLDFGLAKLCPGVWGAEGCEASTLTEASTREGTLAGTPAYMSPEQARGEDLDERTDIWAFGCVLYRMVTGREAFSGRSAADTITAILEQDPDWNALPLDTPASVRRLLRRCLEKDRKRRLRDFGEALADIDDAANPPVVAAQDADRGYPRGLLSRRRMALALTAASAIVGGAIYWAQRRDALTPPTRFTVSAPPGFQVTSAGPALSPDGRQLVFSACTVCDTEDLTNWVPHRRPLDQFQAAPIPDARGAFLFFFSPDGQSIGFATREGLKKIPLAGGTPVTLYEGPVLGADWGQDGTIVFASASGLMRVPAAGGKPQVLTRAKPGTYHVSPAVLPGSAGVLFTEWEGHPTTGTGRIAVRSFDAVEEQVLLKGSTPRVLPTGHLVFAREHALWAVPFDERALKITGEAVPVVEGLAFQSQFDMAAFNVSRDGTLVFLTGDAPKPAARTLTWITRQGHEEPFNLAPASYGWPRVAPDGRHVALDIIGANGRSDIWLYDMTRRTLGRLTDDLDIHLFPVWTKDSQHVVFTSGPPFSFFVTPIDGRASSRLLATTNAPGALAASDWSSDGQFIVFSFLSTPRMGDNPAFDIGMLPANGGGPLKLLLHSDAAEVDPDISPDGNWIAYSCNRTGRYEIYVERFPDLGERQIVSTNGGVEPLWAPSGTEIFYRNIDGRRMLAVPFDPRSGIPGRASTLFEGSFALYLSGLPFRSYDVSPDARRFVMVKNLPRGNRAAPATEINVVMNWSQELTRRVPVR